MVWKPGSKHSDTSSRVIARRNDWNSICALHQGPRSMAASRGRIHDRSPIACRNTKKALAERGPSIHDVDIVSRSRGASRPRFASSFGPPRDQRAQGRPGACCTRGLACDLRKQKCTRAYRAAGTLRPSLRNGFTAYFVLFPENGSFASVATREASPLPDLAPAPRRPNHTTSPYAPGAYVSRLPRPPHLTARS